MAILGTTQGITPGSATDLVVRFSVTTLFANGIEQLLNEIDNDEEEDVQVGRDRLDKKLATMVAEKITGFDPAAFEDKVK
jgi:hypothetical protein